MLELGGGVGRVFCFNIVMRGLWIAKRPSWFDNFCTYINKVM